MLTALAGEVLATGNFGDDRSGSLAGPMGLLVILALAAITIFLMRSMNKHLRRVPERFPDPSRKPEARAVEESSADDTT